MYHFVNQLDKHKTRGKSKNKKKGSVETAPGFFKIVWYFGVAESMGHVPKMVQFENWNQM